MQRLCRLWFVHPVRLSQAFPLYPPTVSIDDQTKGPPPARRYPLITLPHSAPPSILREQKGSVEDLTDWQARSAKKYPNQMGAGHVYVKLKGKATYGKDPNPNNR